MIPTILVLEDSEYRIEWLRRALRLCGDIDIIVTDNPESFIEAAQKPHDLVIFDHDLGLLDHNGYDAALLYEPLTKVPAIVWSVNGYGAQRISEELSRNGIMNVVIPFLSSNYNDLVDHIIMIVADVAPPSRQ